MQFPLSWLRLERAPLGLLSTVTLLAACSSDPTTPTPSTDEPVTPTSPVVAAFTAGPNAAFLVGAGDIAGCATSFHDEETAALMVSKLAANPAALAFAVGDAVYENGTTSEFNNCYTPTWGQSDIMSRLQLPVVGNHEYNTSGATPYFDYFNGVGVDSGLAGKRGKGYYSYELSQYWHVVVLNSNSSKVSTSTGSNQEKWLKADLASPQASGKCVLAMMHHPQFASYNTTNPPAQGFTPFWVDLYNAGVDLVLVGHSHFYERFAPQTPKGLADNTFGIRQIIIGTGGVKVTTPKFIRANSEVVNGTTFGVLSLTLDQAAYYWEFAPAGSGTFTDEPANQQAVPCHGKPPANVKPTAGYITEGGNYTCYNLTCSFRSDVVGAERSFDPDRPTDPPSETGLVAWKWTFGNGRTSTSQNKVITYGSAGTFTVKLTVTDGRSATASKTHQVTVSAGPPPNTPPVAGFTETCTLLSCQFTDTSTDPGGSVTGWSWDFGDSGTSPDQNPLHPYAAAGTYTVTLIATDDGGLTNTTSHQVTVTGP